MSKASSHTPADRLDSVCLWAATLFPVSLALGNVFFEASVGLAGAAWLARMILRRESPLVLARENRMVLPWACFAAAIIISLLVNGAGSKGFGHDLASLRFLLFGLAVLDVSRRRPAGRYLVMGLAAGILTAAFNTFLAYTLGHDIFLRPLSRYTGKLRDANRILHMTAYGAPIFFAWALADPGLSPKKRAGLFAVAAVAMLELLQMGARTPIIASFAGTFFAVVVIMARVRRTAWGLAVLALFAAGALAVASYRHMWHLMSFYDRIYIWRVSAGMFLEHPLTGVGVGSFREAYQQMAASGAVEPFVSPTGRTYAAPLQTHSHNLYLMLLASTGLLGFISFFWLFVEAAARAWNNLDGFRVGLVSIPAVLLVAGLAGENIFYSTYLSLVSFLFALMGSDPGRDGDFSPGAGSLPKETG